jgi:hypothetical protein
MFKKGFEKVAGIGDTLAKSWKNPAHLDQAGLGALALAPAYHGYKAFKNKDKGEAALAGTELGGLALLSRAVSKAKH